MSHAYANVSPYSYGLNDPIKYTDPTGASVEKYEGEEAQNIFSGLKNNYNSAVASGQKVNKNLWSSGSSSGGGVGLQASNYNSSALSSQFSSLFGMLSGGGEDDEEAAAEEEGEGEGKSWLRSAADWIPFLGSGLGFYDAYQAGDKWGMAFYGAMFVSDFFLVGTVVKGIAKGGIKAFSKNYRTWSSWRGFYGPKPKGTGYAVRNQQLHHWLLKRNGATRGSGFGWKIRNQMWNLIPMSTDNLAIHQLLHNGGRYRNSSKIRQHWMKFYYGTPTYLKAFPTSVGLRLIDSN